MLKLTREFINKDQKVTRCPEAVIRYRKGNGKGPVFEKPNVDEFDDLTPIVFNIDTYRTLTTSKVDKDGIHAFELVSDFFTRFEDTEHKVFYWYYRKAREAIESLSATNYHTVINEKLANVTTSIFHMLNVPQRALDYINSIGFPLPELSHVGTHIKDSEKMSFHEKDYYPLTAIALMCKLLFPIWGQMLEIMKTRKIINPINKELFCFNLIRDTLYGAPAVSATTNKLLYYISRSTRNAMSPRRGEQSFNDFYMAESGVGDDEAFFDIIFSIVAVKRLPSFDIWQKDVVREKARNLMTYIDSVTKETARTKLKNMRDATDKMPRYDAPDGDSEDNMTYMDHVSRSSTITADIPIVVQVGLEFLIPQFLKRYGIPKEVYEESLAYYKIQEPQASLFNRSMVASAIAKELGGDSLIQFLMKDQYVSALTAVQLMMAYNGFHRLAVFMTSDGEEIEDLNLTKTEMGIIHRMKTSLDKNPARDECRRIFPGFSEKIITVHQAKIYGKMDLVGKTDTISIDKQLERILEWIGKNIHRYNLSPAVSKVMEMPVISRGTIVVFDDKVMQEVCEYFLKCHQPKDDISNVIPIAL